MQHLVLLPLPYVVLKLLKISNVCTVSLTCLKRAAQKQVTYEVTIYAAHHWGKEVDRLSLLMRECIRVLPAHMRRVLNINRGKYRGLVYPFPLYTRDEVVLLVFAQ